MNKESSSAYGYDLIAAIDEPVIIKPNEVVFIKTGISTHVKYGGFFGMIVSRPKLAAKSGIVVANGVGIIEPDYQGEWVVALKNTSDVDFVVNPLDKIAKALFVCGVSPSFNVVEEFGSEGRTHKAFGGTDVKK
jgi:dUTP pyrophosphatase